MRSQQPEPAQVARRRGRPPSIDREQIVEAALAIIASQGISGLTMKALAEQLGVTTMATYRHISSKQDLVELVVGVLQARVPVPDPGSGSWSERLWEYMWGILCSLAEYPGLDDYLWRGELTDEGLVVLHTYMDIIRGGGFDDDAAALVFSDIYAYMYGRQALRARHVARRRSRAPRRRRVGPVPMRALASEAHARHGYERLVAALEAELATGRPDGP